MAAFSIQRAIVNSGLNPRELDIVFICWKTSDQVYRFLNGNGFKYIDMEYDEGKGFLWNLYKGWNLGYEIGFRHADYVCPIATDHAYHYGWLSNLMKHAKSNRIVNCKLIEPGTLPTLHEVYNFGPTYDSDFNEVAFSRVSAELFSRGKGLLAVDESSYGHRFDAMPFVISRDVWERFGPMSMNLVDGSPDPDRIFVNGVTGDTDFFNRCKTGGVEIVKALDAISYHCGGLETRRGETDGRYT